MSTRTDSLVSDIATRLIRCPSVTGPGAEREVVEALDGILSTESRVIRRVVSAQGTDRPNLVATLAAAEPGPTLLLTGHLDVVPADVSRWTHPPFAAEVVGGELWGRGAADMKGGVAALAAAFISTARRGGPACGQLILAATADEEDEGRWGLPWLVTEGGLRADAAVIAEPAGLEDDFDRVPIATRGAAFATVRVTSPGGHASFGEALGLHAVSVACRMQQALESGFSPTPTSHWAFPGGATVVAGESFRGGERLGDLPRMAEFSVSCRLLPGANRADFLPELRAFVAPLVPVGCTFEVEFNQEVSAWAPGMDLDMEDPFAGLALRAVHDAGYPNARFGGFPAFSEGTFLAQVGVPTLAALGPGALARAHLPDERVSIRALEASVRIYETIIHEVLRPGSSW